MLTHFVDLVPQSHKVGKGIGLVLRAAQQGGRVEGAHEQDAVLLNELPVLLGHRKVGPDHPLGGDAAQAHHDLGPQQAELLPQPGHAGLALGGQRVTVLGRAALDDVGNVAVLFPVQVDGKQILVQQLTAAAHKGQALLVLALAGALAHKQHFGVRHALPEHHIRAGLAQLTAAAGKAVGFQRFPIHGGSISF